MLDAMTPGSGIIRRCTRPRGCTCLMPPNSRKPYPIFRSSSQAGWTIPILPLMLFLTGSSTWCPSPVRHWRTRTSSSNCRPTTPSGCVPASLVRRAALVVSARTPSSTARWTPKPDARPTPTCTRCYRTMPSGCSSSELGWPAWRPHEFSVSADTRSSSSRPATTLAESSSQVVNPPSRRTT